MKKKRPYLIRSFFDLLEGDALFNALGMECQKDTSFSIEDKWQEILSTKNRQLKGSPGWNN